MMDVEKHECISGQAVLQGGDVNFKGGFTTVVGYIALYMNEKLLIGHPSAVEDAIRLLIEEDSSFFWDFL